MKRNITVLFALILLTFAAASYAAAPKLISYQGYLTDNVGDPVADGLYNVTLTIYDDLIAGVSVWTEAQNLSTTGGQFSIQLGSVNAISDTVFRETTRYLGIAVAGDPEITPRTVLVSVPYAQRVSTIDGASGGFLFSDLVIGDSAGDTLVKFGPGIDGGGAIALSDPSSTSPTGRAAGFDPKVELTPDGIIFFGATSADTTLCLFNNGDIQSIGRISVGANSAASGNFSTAFGYNNDASGDSATIGGGYNNVASGFSSTIGGGNENTAEGGHNIVIGGGGGNFVSTNFGVIAGGIGNVNRNGHGSVISGGSQNYTDGSNSAVVSGGQGNRADYNYATVGGGLTNHATDTAATVSGGMENRVGWGFVEGRGQYSTVGGGKGNDVGIDNIATYSTIAGGASNTAGLTNDASYSAIGGGDINTVDGQYATIPGGRLNLASGNYSFATGRRAKATHAGAFVWGDSHDGDVTSSATNQFTARTSGGVRFYSNTALTTGVTLAAGGGAWASVSDRNLKENIRAVDGSEILKKISQLDISRWNYVTQDETVEHIGPMAQDFHKLFGVGDNNTTITTIDPDGISLAAIKALIKKNNNLEESNEELKAEMEQLKALVQEFLKQNKK